MRRVLDGYATWQELFASETFDPATFLAAEQQLHSLTVRRLGDRDLATTIGVMVGMVLCVIFAASSQIRLSTKMNAN